MDGRKCIASAFSAILGLAIWVAGCGDEVDEEDQIVKVTILQTADFHHHGYGSGAIHDYTPLDTTDEDTTRGGYARLATVIRNIRAEQEAAGTPVLVVDSGDFVAGTIFDILHENPLSLQYFAALDYDAITLGNHDFERGPNPLATILSNRMAASSPFEVPIVTSNSITDDDDPNDDLFEDLFEQGGLCDRLVLELPNGLRVGFLGLMGKKADAYALGAPPVTFNHEYEFIQGLVDGLRNDEEVDLVVALSHTGINPDLESGEDVDLAAEVQGIDFIASGHSHLATPEPIWVGDTMIFQPGRYGEWLSRVDITYNLTQDAIESTAFELIPIDDSIEGDPEMQALVDSVTEEIDEILMEQYGLESTAAIAEMEAPLERHPLVEIGLGNLCADAVRTIATELSQQSSDPTPAAVGVIPNGVVRSSLYPDSTGMVRFADIYRVMACGITLDPANTNWPGWPLISVYLTAPELRNVCEIMATAAPLLEDNLVFLNFAGIRFEYDPEGIVFHRVSAIYLCGDTLPAEEGGDGDRFSTNCDTPMDLEDETTLYRVIVDLYTLLEMKLVTNFMTLVPKFADGTPIDLTDPDSFLQTRLDNDSEQNGIQEVKSWDALLRFIQQLPDLGGDPDYPDIPESIYGPEGDGMGRPIPVTPEQE